MNKQIVLIGLVAVFACFAVCAIADEEAVAPVADDADEAEADGGILTDMWGQDVLEDGVPDLVGQKKGPCASAKNEQGCRVCCENIGQSHTFKIQASKLYKGRICHCFNRMSL